MNLCFVCSEYPPYRHGGIGTLVQLLARALVERGHSVRVIGVYAASAGLPVFERDAGVEVWRVQAPAWRAGWVAARIQLFRLVREWSRGGDIDLIEVPDWEGPAAGWPRLPVPVVARLHGTATYFAAELGRSVRGSTRWLERRSLDRCDFRCATSDYVLRRTRELFDMPACEGPVLYNGVELAPSAGKAPRTPHRVVFTGTLTEKKGIVALVRAWPVVHASHPAAELHVYGKDCAIRGQGSMQRHLSESLDPSVRASVHFHGHVERHEVLEALSAARTAVFPSYTEAFALAPLEAMACGCPTITTRRGSGPELAQDGRDALLVDPDAPEEIARAILGVLRSDELAGALGRAGQKRVEDRFSLDAAISRSEAFHAGCIGAFAGRARA